MIVTLAIIGLLVALLLPALHAARSAARRTQCANNLRQIGLALHQYHSRVKSFPIGCWEYRVMVRDGRQLAWSAFVLPDLDQTALFDAINAVRGYDSPANTSAAGTVLDVFLCPSTDRVGTMPTFLADSVGDPLRFQGRALTDYGGMFGERIMPRDAPKILPGSMLYGKVVSLAMIRDGSSQTILVGEDSGFPLEGQWINGANIFDQAFAINAAPWFENDLSSDHHDGAFALMADGAVRFLNRSMPLPILAALCTRAGGEIVSGDKW